MMLETAEQTSTKPKTPSPLAPQASDDFADYSRVSVRPSRLQVLG
jgi:hypothetical protein